MARCFRLEPPWNSERNNPYPWVDSADGLFGSDYVGRIAPLRGSWRAPDLLRSSRGPDADAYCVPGGLFVFAETAVRVLGNVFGDSVEWLPVRIDGAETFHLLHPLREYALGPRARTKTNPVSLNITRIEACDFPSAVLDSEEAFKAAQPPDSAAAKAGFSFGDVFTGEKPAEIWNASGFKGVTFAEVPVAKP